MSLGIVMIAMGFMGASGFGQGRPSNLAPYFIAGALVGAGVIAMLRRPQAFFIALAAATTLVLSGIAGFAGHPELGMPIPPALAIGIGIYLCLRIALGRAAFRPPASRDE